MQSQSSYELECLSCEIRDFIITNAGAGNATAIRNKVVAGREFNYRAINVSSRDINWELGEAPTWTINPVSPTTWDLNTNRRKSRGIGIVDNSIMPLSNGDFGATNGLVKIVDLPSGNDVRVDNVEVFFPKDEMNIIDPSVPNWFYYWRQFILGASPNTTIHFDNTLNGYAATNPFSRKIFVAQLASEYNDETKHNGIHTFYETVEHENHHRVFWDQWWPNGYDSSLDGDGDFYPDDWEDNDPVAQDWMFSSGDAEKRSKVDFGLLREQGLKSNRAIITIAKKLINRVRYVWRTGKKLE